MVESGRREVTTVWAAGTTHSYFFFLLTHWEKKGGEIKLVGREGEMLTEIWKWVQTSHFFFLCFFFPTLFGGEGNVCKVWGTVQPPKFSQLLLCIRVAFLMGNNSKGLCLPCPASHLLRGSRSRQTNQFSTCGFQAGSVHSSAVPMERAALPILTVCCVSAVPQRALWCSGRARLNGMR